MASILKQNNYEISLAAGLYATNFKVNFKPFRQSTQSRSAGEWHTSCGDARTRLHSQVQELQQLMVPFVAYADFEAVVKKVQSCDVDSERNCTKVQQRHADYNCRHSAHVDNPSTYTLAIHYLNNSGCGMFIHDPYHWHLVAICSGDLTLTSFLEGEHGAKHYRSQEERRKEKEMIKREWRKYWSTRDESEN